MFLQVQENARRGLEGQSQWSQIPDLLGATHAEPLQTPTVTHDGEDTPSGYFWPVAAKSTFFCQAASGLVYVLQSRWRDLEPLAVGVSVGIM